MNNIIEYLMDKDWPAIKKAIELDQINWDQLVDQTNGTLHYLAYHGQIDLIETIDMDTFRQIVQQPNVEGNTIAHIASKLDYFDILILALKTNPNIIYQKNRLGYTPLFYSVSNDKIIREIVCEIDIEDHFLNDEYTILEYYVLSKNLDMVDYLLNNITTNDISPNVFFTTIQSDNDTKIELLKKFIDHGLDINVMNSAFLTPLIVAIYQDNYDVSQFLLQNGANPNFYGPENHDHPLTIAIVKSNNALVRLLIDYQTNAAISDKYLKTPLHYAFSSSNTIHVDVKRLLLSKTDNINKPDNRMNSILNLLLHNDDWRNYQDILEERKLKIYLKNKDGISPIDAIKSNQMDSFLEVVYRSYLNQLDSEVEWVDSVDRKIALIVENGDDIQSYREYIIGKILRGQSYPLKKHSQMIKLIQPPKSNITHFSAYSYNYICFLYYILKKYPQIKIPAMAKDQMKNKTLKNLYDEMAEDYQDKTPDHSIFRSIIRDYINHSPSLINHIIIWKNETTYFISPYIVQGIHQTLTTHPDTQFIILKITIVSDKSFNHANIVIYDVKNEYVERFDPYGKVPFYHSQQIDVLIKSFFGEYFPNVKYLSPAMMTDGISFQIFSDERNKLNYVENDPAGFCIAWCLWYLEMRIKNIKISPKSLIKRTIHQINKSEDKFKDYIRNYSNYLDMEKNKILKKAAVPSKFWYTLHIPIDTYKAYLKYIRRAFNQFTS